MAVFGLLAALLAWLTIAVRGEDIPMWDVSVLRSICALNVPGLSGFSQAVSAGTATPAAVAFGSVAVTVLWLLKRRRAAWRLLVALAMAGVAAGIADDTLGEIVEHAPPGGEDDDSFPSGHVIGATIVLGSWGYVAIKGKLGAPTLALVLGGLTFSALAVGFSRLLEGEHYPSDVIGGHLVGALWLFVLIPIFMLADRAPWAVRLGYRDRGAPPVDEISSPRP
jgi:undecaprenyl-diphosphatase